MIAINYTKIQNTHTAQLVETSATATTTASNTRLAAVSPAQLQNILNANRASAKALSSVTLRPTIVSQTKSEYSPKLPYALRVQRLAVDVDLAARQTRMQSYIDQLQYADSLVQQAMDLLSRPHSGAGFAALGSSALVFVDFIYAQSLMAAASGIRQSVANSLPADLQSAIKDADALEQQAFLKVQSNDPYVVSDAATDLRMGMERFSLIEQDILKRDI